MAIGTAPQRPGLIAYTIYVRPSPDLAQQSWQWPQSWHDEFVHARWSLGLAAAWCIALGGTFDNNPQLPRTICGMSFIVERKDNSFYITILQFEGPQHDPSGPNGGARQPAPVNQLVLGLRGANRHHHLVVFQGVAPPTPGPHSQRKVVSAFKAHCSDQSIVNANGLFTSIHEFEADNPSIEIENPIIQQSGGLNRAGAASMEKLCRYNAATKPWIMRKSCNQLSPISLAKSSCICFGIESPKPILPSLATQNRPGYSTKASQKPGPGLLQNWKASSQRPMRLDSNHDGLPFTTFESYLH